MMREANAHWTRKYVLDTGSQTKEVHLQGENTENKTDSKKNI